MPIFFEFYLCVYAIILIVGILTMEAMYQFAESSLQKVGLNVDPEFLVKFLESLGIGDPSDVQRLTETDLSGALTEEEARAILAYWFDSSKRYVLLLVLRLQAMPSLHQLAAKIT